MAQPDHIDTLLDTLNQALGNTLTMVSIIRQLRRSQHQLLPALHTMLREVCEHIVSTLPELPPEQEGEHHG